MFKRQKILLALIEQFGGELPRTGVSPFIASFLAHFRPDFPAVCSLQPQVFFNPPGIRTAPNSQ
jgi:hypothetical protein